MGQNFDQATNDNTFWPMPNIVHQSVNWKENYPNLSVWRGLARPATTIFAHCAFRHPNHKKNIWHKRVSVLTSCLGMKTFFSSMTRSFLTHLKMGNFEKNSHVCMYASKHHLLPIYVHKLLHCIGILLRKEHFWS